MGKCSHLKTVLQACEEDVVRETLKKCNWDMYRTAKILGIGLSSLYRKIGRYGIRKVPT